MKMRQKLLDDLGVASDKLYVAKMKVCEKVRCSADFALRLFLRGRLAGVSFSTGFAVKEQGRVETKGAAR